MGKEPLGMEGGCATLTGIATGGRHCAAKAVRGALLQVKFLLSTDTKSALLPELIDRERATLRDVGAVAGSGEDLVVFVEAESFTHQGWGKHFIFASQAWTSLPCCHPRFTAFTLSPAFRLGRQAHGLWGAFCLQLLSLLVQGVSPPWGCWGLLHFPEGNATG